MFIRAAKYPRLAVTRNLETKEWRSISIARRRPGDHFPVLFVELNLLLPQSNNNKNSNQNSAQDYFFNCAVFLPDGLPIEGRDRRYRNGSERTRRVWENAT